MIKITWDPGFKASYKERVRNHPNLKKKFVDSIEIFEHDPFDPRLRTHKLSGKLSGAWAYNVDSDCRVVFTFKDNRKTAHLIDIGSHEEVY